MRGSDYSKKHYPGLPSYGRIAAKAFDDGKAEGLNESADARIKKLEVKLRETEYLLACRENELKEVNEMLRDPQGLADYIAGI